MKSLSKEYAFRHVTLRLRFLYIVLSIFWLFVAALYLVLLHITVSDRLGEFLFGYGPAGFTEWPFTTEVRYWERSVLRWAELLTYLHSCCRLVWGTVVSVAATAAPSCTPSGTAYSLWRKWWGWCRPIGTAWCSPEYGDLQPVRNIM
jgi:hypothetical protein